MLYRIADHVFDIRPIHSYFSQFCRDYLAQDGARAEFTIAITEEELERERQLQPSFSAGYHEVICVLRRICELLAPKGIVLLHAATLVVDGVGYAFSAPSGTGKSTHIRLWLEELGERAYILNGDKPFVGRAEDGDLRLWGSPWCGKEHWNRNASASFGGLCFLERSSDNRICRIGAKEGVERIFRQLLRPKGDVALEQTLLLADAILREVPVYLLGCNISREAAQLAIAAMHGAV